MKTESTILAEIKRCEQLQAEMDAVVRKDPQHTDARQFYADLGGAIQALNWVLYSAYNRPTTRVTIQLEKHE